MPLNTKFNLLFLLSCLFPLLLAAQEPFRADSSFRKPLIEDDQVIQMLDSL